MSNAEELMKMEIGTADAQWIGIAQIDLCQYRNSFN